MKDLIEMVYFAQQTLERATTPQAAIDGLRDTLARLLGDAATITFGQVDTQDSTLAQEANATLMPAVSADGCHMVIPLTAEEVSHGLISIDTPQPMNPHLAALAATLSHIAAVTLSRLAWPASPQTFRQLVENANVAIDVADINGKVTYANLAAAQLYGYNAPEELIGRNVSDLYYADEELRIQHEVLMQTRTQDGWTGDVTHQQADGQPFPVRLAIFGLRDPQNRMMGFGAIAQSLGEQQRLLLSLQQQTRRLRAAAQVARASISKLDLESLVYQVASVTQSLFNFDLVSVCLVEQNRLAIKAVCSANGRLTPGETQLPIDDTSLNGWVALTGRQALVNDTTCDERYRPIEGTPVALSEMVVPVKLGERVIGTLDVQSAVLNAFQPEDTEILQGIADQLAGAIDNARLFTAERTQVRKLAALNAISETLVAAYNLDELWGGIYEQISGLFNISTFYVMRYDAATNMLSFEYLGVDGAAVEPEPPYPLSGLSGYVIQSGQPLILHDLPAQREWLQSQGVEPLPIWGQLGARSWLGVPLRTRDGRLLGLISVQSARPGAFDENDLDLLTTIGTQVSLAMENARLIEQLTEAARQLKERARRMESLYRVGALLSTSLDRKRFLTLAAEQIVKLMGVEHCGIVLVDEPTGRWYLVAEYPPTEMINMEIPYEGNPIAESHRENDIFYAPDVENEPRLEPVRASLKKLDVRSLLVARLMAKGRLIGSLGLDSIGQQRHFSSEEIETVRTLAAQVALAVDNSNLYAAALAANELKSQFLATMSHELRTPLNAILGYTEMLLAAVYGPVNERQRDRLGRVFSNARHLLELINDLLDLARIESGRMTLHLDSLDIVPLINGAMTNISPLAERKGLSLGAELPPDLPRVFGDGIRLRQVIVNLLSNAVKFTHQGNISVRAAPVVVSRGECTTGQLTRVDLLPHDGQWLAISVADTGIGIAPENYEMIFDAFRQVDSTPMREYSGTGLGLSITRQLVEMHGGKLWVESEVGRGSVFTFVLPVPEPINTRSAPDSPQEQTIL